jgi:hypothetical protein
LQDQFASFQLDDDLPQTDVAIYGIVHGILEAERARDTKERRAGRRHPYRCIQWIAPIDGERLPGPLQFRPVQCLDLSAAGLLYLADESPAGTGLVVALGGEQKTCLRAEVVRDERVVHEGRPVCRVACRFTGRANES